MLGLNPMDSEPLPRKIYALLFIIISSIIEYRNVFPCVWLPRKSKSRLCMLILNPWIRSRDEPMMLSLKLFPTQTGAAKISFWTVLVALAKRTSISAWFTLKHHAVTHPRAGSTEPLSSRALTRVLPNELSDRLIDSYTYSCNHWDAGIPLCMPIPWIWLFLYSTQHMPWNTRCILRMPSALTCKIMLQDMNT